MKWILKAVLALIAACVAAAAMYVVVWVWIIGGLFTLVSNTDWSGGIKPVIQSMWCGEAGCTDENS